MEAPPLEPGMKLAKRYLSLLTISRFVGAEGVVAGVEDDLTRSHREPVTARIEILLGAQLQGARQGLRDVEAVTQDALDVEGRVRIDGEV